MMPTMLRRKVYVARKVHHCLTCGIAIQPGERYDRAVYIGDDGLYEWVCCSPCADLTNVVWTWAGDPWEGITNEDYDEWASENPNDLAAVAFLARRAQASRASDSGAVGE